MPSGATPQQVAHEEYRQAVISWKENLLATYDRMDQIILILAGGDPEKLYRYRTQLTHTELAEAYLAARLTQ